MKQQSALLCSSCGRGLCCSALVARARSEEDDAVLSERRSQCEKSTWSIVKIYERELRRNCGR